MCWTCAQVSSAGGHANKMKACQMARPINILSNLRAIPLTDTQLYRFKINNLEQAFSSSIFPHTPTVARGYLQHQSSVCLPDISSDVCELLRALGEG